MGKKRSQRRRNPGKAAPEPGSRLRTESRLACRGNKIASARNSAELRLTGVYRRDCGVT